MNPLPPSNQAPDQCDAPARLRERLVGNLAALYRRDAALAAELDALPAARLPTLEPAKSGEWTARVAADDGPEVWLHSRYEPSGEAERAVHALPGDENATYVIAGMGLGYLPAALERLRSEPVLIVAESDPALLKAALCVHDFSTPILSGRMIFLRSAEKSELHEKLSRCNADMLLGFQLLEPPHTRRKGLDFAQRIRAQVSDFVAYQRMQMLTLLKTSQKTFRNVVMNLPHYLASADVNALKSRAAGMPAIVVAAGPSLARHLPLLAELRERAVVIAVQTVYKPLLASGCRPHFVTSLDFHDVSLEFFRAACAAGRCALVAEPKASPLVLDAFDGQRFVLHHGYFDRLLRGAAPRRGGLPAGTTVAHLAFYLAQHLGCDPILLVGQDLAFTQGLFYLPGSPIEDIWAPELNRFQTVESKQWERIVRNRPILKRSVDLHGAAIYTDDLLLTYYEQFRKDFAAAPQRVVQCTEGGLALPEIEAMPLAEAARRFCTCPIDASRFSSSASEISEAEKEAVVRALDARIAELNELTRISEQMLALLAELAQRVDRPDEFNRLVAKVDALRVRIQRYDEMYRLVADVSAEGQLRRHSADRRIGSPERETAEVARARLERDRDHVAAFLETCRFMREVLPTARERLRSSPA